MRRLMLSAALALLAAGCDSNNSVSPSVSLTGNYSLQTVNGQALPYTFSTSQGTFQLQADVLTLNADGSYQDIGQYISEDTGQPFTSTEIGTYSAVNGSITFFDQTDGIEFSGSLSGSILTEIAGGVTEVFRKE